MAHNLEVQDLMTQGEMIEPSMPPSIMSMHLYDGTFELNNSKHSPWRLRSTDAQHAVCLSRRHKWLAPLTPP
jgi:hypothetical protein